MIPRVALLIPILELALCSFGQVPSVQDHKVTGSGTDDPQILEAGIRATLEKDLIRVTLPWSASPRPGAQVVLWLASPRDVRTAEVVAALSANGEAASAAIPWPLDARGEREGNIGWYRIGYRVEVDGVERSHGIVSVGAIATNLLELRLAYPKVLLHGHSLSADLHRAEPCLTASWRKLIAQSPPTHGSRSGMPN